MSGLIAGLIVCTILTIIGVGFICYAKNIEGISSIYFIQTGMFLKLVLGCIFTLIIVKLVPYKVDLWSYAMTLGIYGCVIYPLIAFLMVRKDVSQKRWRP
jgi:hypothetical protein